MPHPITVALIPTAGFSPWAGRGIGFKFTASDLKGSDNWG
jgi:hypothetical protein